MASLGIKRVHLVLGDSRLSGIQTLVNGLNVSGEYMEIEEHKGASFESLVLTAESFLPTHPFDVVYITGGVNDITTKDKSTGRISYEWGVDKSLEIHMITNLVEADLRLRDRFPASKVVFCPLIGSDLSRVVNGHNTTLEDQEEVDNMVWEYNTHIFRINKERGTVCPALHHQVHRFCKGKRRTYYHHLGDGIHLTGFLRDKWAKQFVTVMAHN